MKKTLGLHKRQTVGLFIVVVVVVLAAGGFLYYKNHNKHKVYKTTTAANAALASQELASKDYKAYQLRRSIDANDYIAKGDYKSAEKTLGEITKNVPADQITSQTYRAFWSLYSKTGDIKSRHKYASLTAQALKKEGNGAAAFGFEQDAKVNN